MAGMPRKGRGGGSSSPSSFAAQFARALAAGELDDILSSNGWSKTAATPPARAGAGNEMKQKAEEKKKKEEEKKQQQQLQQQGQQQQQQPNHAGWTKVTTKKPRDSSPTPKQQQQPPKPTSELDPRGWSAKIVPNPAALTREEACVCTASLAEATKAVAELTSDHPMAVLSTAPVNGKGELVHALVKSPNGRLDVRKRFLIQLGAQPVTYMCDAPKAAPVGQQDPSAVVYFVKDKTPPAVWKAATEKPKEAVNHWIKHFAGIDKCSRFREPRMTANQIAVTVDTSPSNVQKLIKACGTEGVFTRKYYTQPEHNEEYKVAPLGTEHNLAAALRIANSIPYSAGVLPTRKGWSVRVPTDKLQDAIRITCPADENKVLGCDYDVQGLPLSWTDEHVIKFLGDWNATPMWSFRRGWQATWVVRARTPPPSTVLQNADGDGLKVLATIQERSVKPKKQEAVYKWTPQAKQNGKPSLPAAWSKQAATTTAKATADEKEEDEPMENKEEEIKDAIGLQAPQTPAPATSNGHILKGDPPNFQAMIQAAIAAAMAPLQQQINNLALMVQQESDAEGDDDEANAKGGGKGKGGKARPPAPPAVPGFQPY